MKSTSADRSRGSLQVLAGDVEITGEVGGAVRALAGDVTISGDVGRDVVVGAGNLTLQGSGSVEGDVIAAGGDVELLGPVGGDVTGNFGSITINNRVGGDVDVTADDVNLLSQARIQGDLAVFEPRRGGSCGRRDGCRRNRAHPEGAFVSRRQYRRVVDERAVPVVLRDLLSGLVLILLLPRAITAIADAARTAPVTSFLLGSCFDRRVAGVFRGAC